MRILVTGASGFIGSHIVEQALSDGHEVWAAVRKTSSRAYLRDERIRFVELDLLNRERLEGQLREGAPTFDCVIHAAGATKCLHREDFHLHNTLATQNLVEALISTARLKGYGSADKGEKGRIVFVSSLSLFGAIKEQPLDVPQDGATYPEIKGDDTPQPNTAYGLSKWEAEKYLATVEGLNYVVVRPTGVYGPRERDYFIMAKSIKSHTDFAVGYRRQEITFVYVLDLVQAIMRAMTAQGVEGKAFFISDGATYDSRTFSDLLQRELGVKRVLHIKAPLWFLRAVCAVSGTLCRWMGRVTTLNTDKYHILAQRNWRCDIAPARELLGYAPEWDLERGVKATVKWYKENGWL